MSTPKEALALLIDALPKVGEPENVWCTMHASTLREVVAFIESAGADSERWRHAKRCTRMDNFGGYVVHPDDPVDFDGIVAARFEREIDAERARSTPSQQKEPTE